MPIIKKRTYNSESRKAQAQETRGRIIASARTLFESKGFEKTTIEEIAQSAKVSPPTIYALFQSKIGILRDIMDTVLSHEHYEKLIRKTVAEQSPAKRLAMAATIARQLYDAEREQLGTLESLSILDAELKKFEVERENRRYQRQEKSFAETVRLAGLAKGLDIQKARDILWAFTGRDLYRLLVIERGWTSDEYELWLAHILEKILIKN
jgi:AcrR family transcriptional regulator